MPPQKRQAKKPADRVEVEPASATKPRPGPTTPSKKEVEAATEQSAKFLEEQNAAPTDVHPGPTTPSQGEVDSALEKSAEYLEKHGVVMTETAAAALPVSFGRDMSQDASPVSAGTRGSSVDSSPVSASRDKTMDASPVYVAPPPTDTND